MKATLRQRMPLHLLKNYISHSLDDMKYLIDMTESLLTEEATRIANQAQKDLQGLNEEDREYMIGWYGDDLVRLKDVFSSIQRRALFTAIMSVTETSLILACNRCRHAYGFPYPFKKKGKDRTICQALEYLYSNLKMRDKALYRDWETIYHFWTIRNAFTHNDGKLRAADVKNIADFCASIPTIELNHHNRIILHKGSLEMASHVVSLFFSCLLDEIDRNKLSADRSEPFS